MAVKLSPLFNSQVVTLTGAPASGWKVYTYQAGSSTPIATYTDATGGVAQSQPIILNTLGFPTNGQIWLTSGLSYKLVLTDANDIVQKTEDNISGINDTTTTVDEWADSGLTPTYVSGTSYTVVGDQTSALHIGRRQKFTVTAGTVYGRITNSVFTTLTTVSVQMDGSQVLDSGLTAVQNAILRANALSLPVRAGTASGTDTYTVALGLARYVKDDQYQVKIANVNTSTAPTLNVSSLGAQTIVNIDGSALYAGALNGEHTFRWNGTNMVVVNPKEAQPKDIQNSVYITAAAAGTADAITATFSPAPTALTNGMVVSVRASAANATTTPTFSPNGLTAKTITKGAGQALLVNDIAGAGFPMWLKYDSTFDKWILLNPFHGTNPPLGVGQTLTNMLASRGFSANYTNSTGRTIVAYISFSVDIATTCDALVDGKVVSRLGSAANTPLTHVLIIPAGTVYRATTASGTPTIINWYELI